MSTKKEKVNNTHRQIIFFINGEKRTIDNVIKVWENEMVHIVTIDGAEWIINKKNVLCVKKIFNPYISI